MYRLDYLPLCAIAGSDPTGGAGLQGDLRTFAAHGAHGTAIPTALTVQDRGGVRAVEAVSPDLVAAALAAALEADPTQEPAGGPDRPRALKTGMLANAAILEAVAGVLDRCAPPPLVVDPVLAAEAGGGLLSETAIGLLTSRLAPHATVLTPNLPEAARLLGLAAVPPGGADEAAQALRERGWRAVLLKGGHGEGEEVLDVLATARGVWRFCQPRLRGGAVHGTGCALSASLAVRLARGEALPEAVAGARDYVRRLIADAHARGSWLPAHLAIEPARRVSPPAAGQ